MKVTNTGAHGGSLELCKQSKSDAFSREIENVAKLDEFKQTWSIKEKKKGYIFNNIFLMH